MKQNKYNDQAFFEKYSQMNRSIKGLAGAGEWKTLEKMLPNFKEKRVLDLGCGFGWHCQYAVEQEAKSVVGVDISDKMLAVAKEKTSKKIEYICKPIENLEFPKDSFDVIISSLTFHYVESFDDIVKNVSEWLVEGGEFVFSVEHPIFTAKGDQKWFTDTEGNKLHFPVDNYFFEGLRETNFLGEGVQKYHKTLTTYLNTLLQNSFEITGIAEPKPDQDLEKSEDINEDLRRPLMLIVSAKKKLSSR